MKEKESWGEGKDKNRRIKGKKTTNKTKMKRMGDNGAE